ncbi:MAG: Holliday junction resolvase RuvX [Propionibacteriaceae bacterium]|nr:Holliday junction resolvase RuvX [Propionibacteriaceae bacterium]
MSSAEASTGGFRRGVRLGVDWGKARVGVAACDPDALLAYPVETVPSADEDATFARLADLVEEYGAIEVVMGLPLALDGNAKLAATGVTAVAERLSACLPVPLRLVDERLTTAVAHRQLGRLDSRRRRGVVDQAAATGILEGALEAERNTGEAPGLLVANGDRETKEIL